MDRLQTPPMLPLPNATSAPNMKSMPKKIKTPAPLVNYAITSFKL
jgi:hypothetical protein